MRELQRRRIGQAAIAFVATKSDQVVSSEMPAKFQPLAKEEKAIVRNRMVRDKLSEALVEYNFGAGVTLSALEAQEAEDA